MSSEQKYLQALAARAKQILEEEEEKPKAKAKGSKKEMSEETKARVLENLKKGREKAYEVRAQKNEIKKKEKEQKDKEFEEMKKKYNIGTEKPKVEEEKPKRERATDIPPYKEENDKETDNVSLVEKSKPIDIPKVEIKEEKKEIIIQNSVPTINKPKYIKYDLKFIKKYGSLYN
jgi:hypothetical protein